MNENNANLRRWIISIGLAVLLHGGMAVAVVSWAKAIVPSNRAGSLTIDINLAPLTAEPDPEQSEPPRGSALDRAAGLPAAESIKPNAPPRELVERGGEISEQKAAANGQGSAQPSAAPPQVAAPGASAPSTTAAPDENGAEGRTVGGGGGGGGGAGGAAHGASSNEHGGSSPSTSSAGAGALDRTPIDTSNSVPSLYEKKAGEEMNQKKKNSVLFRPSKHLAHTGPPEHPHSSSAAHGTAPVTNAVGAHVQDRVKAALARGAIGAGTRNAIGGTAATGIVRGGGDANATEGVTKNAIGISVPIHPALSGPKFGERNASPIAAAGAATSRSALDGHAMIRPGSGTGVIGGPAKSTWGVLNGTDFHPRQR